MPTDFIADDKYRTQYLESMRFAPNAIIEKNGIVSGYFYDRTLTAEMPKLPELDANFCVAVLSLMLMRALEQSGLSAENAAGYAEWCKEISAITQTEQQDSEDESEEFDLSENEKEQFAARQASDSGQYRQPHHHSHRHGGHHRRNKT